MKSFDEFGVENRKIVLIEEKLELWVCKIGFLKTKELSVLLSIVLFSMLCFAWFVFCVLFGCFVWGMEWMR